MSSRCNSAQDPSARWLRWTGSLSSVPRPGGHTSTMRRPRVALAVLAMLLVGTGCSSVDQAETPSTPIPVSGDLVVLPYCPVSDDASQQPSTSPSASEVLFEVEAESSGPWRVGTLLSNDGLSWSEPEIRSRDLMPLPTSEQPAARFVIKNYDRPWLPTMALAVGGSAGLTWHPATHMVRGAEGGSGFEYEAAHQELPSQQELEAVTARNVGQASVPSAPESVRALLGSADDTPWARFNQARGMFLDQVVADGHGTRTNLTVERVAELAAGGTGDPFEIVAVSASLARWAGLASRIGFGYDGGYEAGGRIQVTDDHATYFVEVEVGESVWAPLIGRPTKATPCP